MTREQLIAQGYTEDYGGVWKKNKGRSFAVETQRFGGPASGQGEPQHAGGDEGIRKEYCPPARPAKRVRQSSKPLMNKLETEFFERVKDRSYRNTYPQAITFRLANGVRYTPDLCVIGAAGIDCFEIKGKKMWDDAIVKIKVAATIYPRIHWWMVWKKEGVWMEQEIVK